MAFRKYKPKRLQVQGRDEGSLSFIQMDVYMLKGKKGNLAAFPKWFAWLAEWSLSWARGCHSSGCHVCIGASSGVFPALPRFSLIFSYSEI